MRLAYLVILFFALMFLIYSKSSLLDRFAVYFVPITIFVFNKTIDSKIFKISKFYLKLTLVVGYFLLSFLWLEFAYFKEYFVPYKNLLFL